MRIGKNARLWHRSNRGLGILFGDTKRSRQAIKLFTRPCLEALENRLVPASVSIGDSSAIEPGPGGVVNMDFQVTRTGDLSKPLTVDYETVAGSAQPNTDFKPITGTVNFAAGSAAATIAIPIFGNGIFNNPNLSFSVQLTGIAGVVGSPISFANHQDFYVGGTLDSIAIGDINGDGRPDVVVANTYTQTVGVLLNETVPGSDTPAFSPAQNFLVGRDPESVQLADINGDGRPDIVVVNEYDSTISVLLNGTTPGSSLVSFPVEQEFVPGANPVSVAVGDINSDGKPDLVVSDAGSGFLTVLLNTTPAGATSSSFLPPQIFPAGDGLGSVVLGDFNGDGRLDVAVTNSSQSSYDRSLPVAVLLNGTSLGSPTVELSAPQFFPAGPAPVALAVGDINGDGRPDLGVASSTYYESTTQLASVVLNGTSPGSSSPFFLAEQTFPVAFGADSVALADLNSDGKLDMIVANGSDENVSVLQNQTTPGSPSASFAQRANFSVGYSPSAVAAADINGDGEPDILVTNKSDGTVSVLVNNSAPVIARGTATGTIIESDPRHDVVMNGTSGDDTITVNRTLGGGIGDITYVLNGGAPVSLIGVTSFTFYGLDGNDSMSVGPGNGAPLLAGPGPTLFDGGTGTNTLIVDTDGQAARVVPGTITVVGPQNVTFADVSSVEIDNTAVVNAMAGPDTSDRATALAGLTANERFVQGLYLAELGRPGSLIELDGWAQLLSDGNGMRASVTFAIEHSHEARDYLVQSWYVSYLGRQASNGEQEGWVSAMEAGQTNEQVLGAILSSVEFFNRTQELPITGTPDERYVEALYQLLLDRAGSAADTAYWSGVTPAAGRQAVAQAFLDSGEFREDQVEGYYEALFQRPGDANGRDYWAATDLDISTIRVAFLASEEFFENG